MKSDKQLLINNPFIVAGKIPTNLFCDRKAESQRLLREITNGNNLVLISPRRMGKTGLIQHCFDSEEIDGKYDTFYIDILQTSSLREFAYLFGREIFKRLAPRSERHLKKFIAFLKSISGCFGFDPISGLPVFNLQIGDIITPEITIEEIFRYLAESDSPTIVAIDEFQQIANYKDNRNVEALLRSHIQHLTSTRFIFAGSERHLLQQMFTESARPFYNSASILELDAIPRDVYRDFASQLFQFKNKTLQPDVVDIVYQTFEGNTFYLQKVFNIAFSMTPDGKSCDVQIVNSAISDLLASFDTVYREILSSVGEPQKQLLLSVAQEGCAENVTSAKFIRKHSLASASSVQSSLRKLIERGIILKSARQYRLQDPLLRQWLLNTYA